MPWKRLSTVVNDTMADSLSELMTEHGALSVSVEPASQEETLQLYEPGPGETPMWEQARVTGLFEPDSDLGNAISDANSRLGLSADDWQSDTLEDQVWERVWMDDFQPQQIGEQLWICPSWLTPPQPEAINILMDPGLAFGSGTHATTILCLQWLEQHLQPGTRLIDFGCGSGILAIAALRLGAAHAIGIDNDPQAIIASNENAQRNGVSECLQTALPDEIKPPPGKLLVANILASPLMQLAPQLSALVEPSGHIVLSGILATQAEDVAACYRDEFELDAVEQRQDWVRLSGVKRG